MADHWSYCWQCPRSKRSHLLDDVITPSSSKVLTFHVVNDRFFMFSHHALPKQSLSYFYFLHSDCCARGITSVDYGDSFSGRPHGGLYYLWRRSLDPFIELLIYDDEKRLFRLKITTSNATILVVNVYLPHQIDDNVDEYEVIFDSFESSNIFISGNLNADLTKTSVLSPLLNSFISECSFIHTDIGCLPPTLLHMLPMHTLLEADWICTHSSH